MLLVIQRYQLSIWFFVRDLVYTIKNFLIKITKQTFLEFILSICWLFQRAGIQLVWVSQYIVRTKYFLLFFVHPDTSPSIRKKPRFVRILSKTALNFIATKPSSRVSVQIVFGIVCHRVLNQLITHGNFCQLETYPAGKKVGIAAGAVGERNFIES